MQSFLKFPRFKPGNFGLQPMCESLAVGTGGLALTATATVGGHIPVPNRKCALVSLNITAKTAAAGGSTITAQAFRRDNSGAGANVPLTATYDITTFATLDKTYDFPITATDAQRIFAAGDTLRIDLAAATTVTTAPQLCITAVFVVLE